MDATGILHLAYSQTPALQLTNEEAWAEIDQLMERLNHSPVAHAIVCGIDDPKEPLSCQAAVLSLRSIARNLQTTDHQ